MPSCGHLVHRAAVWILIPVVDSFFKILFIYLTEITSRQRGRQREREEEAGSLMSRQPDAALDPRTLGSGPEPKAEVLTH